MASTPAFTPVNRSSLRWFHVASGWNAAAKPARSPPATARKPEPITSMSSDAVLGRVLSRSVVMVVSLVVDGIERSRHRRESASRTASIVRSTQGARAVREWLRRARVASRTSPGRPGS